MLDGEQATRWTMFAQRALIYEADMAKVNPFRTELTKSSYGVVDGCIEPPDGPGLGIEIDENVLEKYPAIPGPCYIPGR